MQDIASPPQANAEVVVNENFRTINPAALYGVRQPATTGLTWGFYGGQFDGNTVADGTVSLTASSTNYVVANRSSGAVSAATGTTNWDNTADYLRLYSVVTGAASISGYVDYRQAYGGTGGGGGGGGLPPTVNHSGTSLDADDSNSGRYTRFTNASAKTYTFDGAETYTVDAEYHGRNVGAGNLTLTEAGGFTINPPAGGTLVIPQGGTFTVKIVAADEADLFGVVVATP